MGLVDSGATVNVLPYELGLELVGDWDRGKASVRLAGSLGDQPAVPVKLLVEIQGLPSVTLAFAWVRQTGVPLILGQTNFFMEFDVRFLRSQLAFEVTQKGSAASILTQLMSVIEDRKAKRPSGSYTTTLFEGGAERIGTKILEEAAELVEAAKRGDEGRHKAVVHEAADLAYHLFVMLGHCDVTLSEVEAELARRFGVSGLEEKARREQRG